VLNLLRSGKPSEHGELGWRKLQVLASGKAFSQASTP